MMVSGHVLKGKVFSFLCIIISSSVKVLELIVQVPELFGK